MKAGLSIIISQNILILSSQYDEGVNPTRSEEQETPHMAVIVKNNSLRIAKQPKEKLDIKAMEIRMFLLPPISNNQSFHQI